MLRIFCIKTRGQVRDYLERKNVMDYINEKLGLAFCILLIGFIVACDFGAEAYASNNVADLFQNANKSYVELDRDASKKKVRDNWVKVICEFRDIAERYPDSAFAPQAYFKVGKVYEHLYRYSGKKSDMLMASKAYQDTAGKYPKNDIADDALFNAGLAEGSLGSKDKASACYRRIIDEYAKGDMVEQARKKLGESTPASDAKASVKAEKPEKIAREETAEKKAKTRSALKNVRDWTAQGNTRVVIDLDGAVPYKTFVIPGESKENRSSRLVIDLSDARMPAGIPSNHKIEDAPVSGIRISQFAADKVRIVLDIKGKPYFAASAMEEPFRIIIDVGNSSASLKSASAELNTASGLGVSSQGAAPQETVPYQSTVKKVAPNSPAKVGDKDDIPTIAAQLSLRVSRIVIDPGHGGKDPGAISPTGMREKDLTLEIGKLLAKRLKADGFEIFMTRSKDEFLTLEERTTFANKKRADLFISVHINSHQNSTVNGIETYFLNLTTDSSAIEVAARENATTQKSISDLQLIINDLMLNSKINESSKFANCVHTSIISSAATTGYDGRNLGVRQAPFYVLLGAQMPSILLELGFLTNSMDIGLLKKQAYQETLVDGIAKGINNYIMNTTYAYSWRNR